MVSSTTPSDPDSLPIALQKGKRTCTTHPITQFVSYVGLSPSFCAFVSFVSTTSIPKSVSEPLSIPWWKQAMIDE